MLGSRIGLLGAIWAWRLEADPVLQAFFAINAFTGWAKIA
jgi:hypothetical protein